MITIKNIYFQQSILQKISLYQPTNIFIILGEFNANHVLDLWKSKAKRKDYVEMDS